MKVIEPSPLKNAPFPIRARCGQCYALLEIEKEDIKDDPDMRISRKYVSCPECHNSLEITI